MRIRNKERAGRPLSSARTAAPLKVAGPAGPEFSEVLEEYRFAEEQKRLGELLARLDECGTRLSQSFTVYDLKAYQDTLRGVLKETRVKAYEVKERWSTGRDGKTKILQTVELIDRELAELAELVMAQQKESLKILEKLECIRGLVVDLIT